MCARVFRGLRAHSGRPRRLRRAVESLWLPPCRTRPPEGARAALSGLVLAILVLPVLPSGSARAQATSAPTGEQAAPNAPAPSPASAPAPASASASASADPLALIPADPDADRHRPGRSARRSSIPAVDPTAVRPIQLQDLYGCVSQAAGAPPDMSPCAPPIPDRWRLAGMLGLVHPRLTDPYNQNPLKGDIPLPGTADWFFIGGLVSDTVLEPRSFPTPTGVETSSRSGENDPFGRSDSLLFSQTWLASAELVKGSTAFKPPELDFKVTLGFNVNYATSPELQVLNIKSTAGATRLDGGVGVQELFVEKHLRNVSDRYDFDSLRVGVQPFSTDFRGFLFQDDQPGVRLFGDRDGNRWQYNLAVFDRLQKDVNSGLNQITLPRADYVFVANLYRQDLPGPGFTSQVTMVYNMNREGSSVAYDANGFVIRPALLGDGRGRDYDVAYLGYNGDGHIDRLNLTVSSYYAFGQDRTDQITGKDARISAFFLAAEPSVDFSYIRVRASALYASGDSHPNGGTETGFDAIQEDPQFAGSDTSYWIRQGIPFIGGGQSVGLVGRNGLLPDLRTSLVDGQSNFINPGLVLLGLGTDADVLPQLRISANINHLDFANTASLEFFRHQGGISPDIGWDVSASTIYRPQLTQNLVLRVSAAALVPSNGFSALFTNAQRQSLYYSVLLNAVLTY